MPLSYFSSFSFSIHRQAWQGEDEEGLDAKAKLLQRKLALKGSHSGIRRVERRRGRRGLLTVSPPLPPPSLIYRGRVSFFACRKKKEKKGKKPPLSSTSSRTRGRQGNEGCFLFSPLVSLFFSVYFFPSQSFTRSRQLFHLLLLFSYARIPALLLPFFLP